jgi:hypothetical protein
VLVGGVRGVGGDEHGVAVGRRARRLLGGQHAAGARLVLDDHRLLGLLGDVLPEHARELVGGAAGGERHDEGDGLLRIRGLREQRAGESGQHEAEEGGPSRRVHQLSPV